MMSKMPTINYTVTSVSTDEVTVDAEVAGKAVKAKVERLTVEATSDDGSMGHTFRFDGADPADFEVGDRFAMSPKPLPADAA